MRMTIPRSLRIIGLTLTSLVVAIYAGLYLLQDSIIFQSTSLERSHVFEFDVPFDEHFIPVSNENGSTDSLNALWFHADSLARGTILYFHGNRGNLRRWGQYASKLTRYGYDVLVIDYRGYGKSTGSPSERNLYADADATYQFVRRRTNGRFVLYGRSLGSAVASYLATATKPDVLILETPFDEIRGVLQPYSQTLAGLLPLKYSLSNADHLRQATCRTIIFHGTNDRIVPLRSAERLREFVAQDDFIVIEGGTHRNLSTFPQYEEKLKKVLTPF